MARGGVYKSEVKRARDTLLAQGTHPSLDAVRIALGNTGSKSTIHKFLKELNSEEGEPVGQRVGLNDALTDLVQRLAAQLQQDANAIVAEAEARFKADRTDLAGKLEAQQAETRRFSESLRQVEVKLAEEQAAHEGNRQSLNELRANSAAQAARIDGLLAQLDERDQRIASLEQKHVQAREALEHFRTAAKEQREQEVRRHDQALQAVQLELRHAGDALTAKNHELQQLHRDNGRLIEQAMTKDRESNTLRRDLRDAEERIGGLEAELSAHRSENLRHQAVTLQRDQLQTDLTQAEQALRELNESHQRVLSERNHLMGRLQALEELVAKLDFRPVDRPDVNNSQP